MSRVIWIVLAVFLIGAAAGLGYAWVISPIRYVDTSPATLRSDFKDSYRAAIAASYGATHNLDRARSRLDLLQDSDSVDALSAQAQRMLAAGDPFDLVQQVAGLASDLLSGIASTAPTVTPAATAEPTQSLPPTLSNPTPSPTLELATATELVPTQAPLPSPTQRPTRTAVPTAAAPFQLVSSDPVCNANLTEGLMQISVLDRHHHQMPGVEIDISWSGGEERFFTGLKPEIADGYADYVMQPGVTYALRVARAGSPVSDLSAPSCPETGGQTFLGGLKLVFQQP